MTSYQTIPVPLVGGSNPNRSRSMNQERTLNMYPEPSGSGDSQSVLHPWPGSVFFDDSTVTGSPRGVYTTSTGELYKVVDQTLYQVLNDGTQLAKGEILGTDYVIMRDDGVNLVLATSDAGYIYDGSSIRRNLSPNFEPGGSVSYLNNSVIWQGNDQSFRVATPGSTPDDIDPLSFELSNSYGDSLLRIYVFRSILYAMGTKTIEPWYFSGEPPSFFSQVNNGKMDIGLISRLAVGSNDNYIYWLGDDKNLYRASAYDPQPLMPPAIHHRVRQFGLLNARVRCISFDGQNFVLLLTNDISLCYSETTRAWFELSYQETEEIYHAFDITYAFDKILMQSRIDGRILHLTQDAYKDTGVPIIRERITAPFSQNGQRFYFRKAELIMESGIGNTFEPNPLIQFSHSRDFGQSWNDDHFIKAGGDHENDLRVEYYEMDSVRQIQFRIRTSDPNFFSYRGLTIDVTAGGRF